MLSCFHIFCLIYGRCECCMQVDWYRTAVSMTIFWLKEKELTPRLFYTVKLQLRHYKSTKVRLIGRSGVRINFWMMPTWVFSGYSTLKFRMMCAIAMCSSSSATRRPVGQKKRTVCERKEDGRVYVYLTNLHTCVAQTQRIRSWMHVVSLCSLCSIALAWSARAQGRYVVVYQS